MRFHVTGPLVSGELRQARLIAVAGNPLFLPSKHLLANHHQYGYGGAGQFARWLTGILTALIRRQPTTLFAAAPAPGHVV